jgi:glutathione peroxidase
MQKLTQFSSRILALLLLSGGASAAAGQCPAFLNHEFKKLHSSERVNLCEAFPGKPLLLVNTASHCGYTPQFAGLEAINQQYRGRGLVVVGFPSDDFNQEARHVHDACAAARERHGGQSGLP